MPITPADVLSAVAIHRYQRLSTNISDFDTGFEASYVVYPSACTYDDLWEEPVAIPRSRELVTASDLGFEATAYPYHVPRSTKTPEETWIRAIAATLNPDLLPREEVAPGSFRWSKRLGDIVVPPGELSFASYLFEAPIIPMRKSPITGKSLAELVGTRGAGAGGIVGVYEGLGHGLLLLVTAPGGMIIGGAAMGVATALEKGLHERILQLITLPNQDHSAGEPSDPRA